MHLPKEDFLYFIWQNQYILKHKLHTKNGEPVEILFPGFRNEGGGPDFTEAKIRIGGQLWFGNVELHVKASDWYVHHHEKDPQYDTVILHAVYEYDMPVFNSKGAEIPALELKNKIPPAIWENYTRLQREKGVLKCARFMPVDPMLWKKWLERLFVERMEEKTAAIVRTAEGLVNDWDEVLFRTLLRYFGMKANTDAFEAVARAIGFKVFRKYLSEPEYLEALLLGTAGLLQDTDTADTYINRLQEHYRFLSAKHGLKPVTVPVKHGGMRPGNFPSVRLAQFARLYHRHPHLFDELMSATDIKVAEQILHTDTSPYWEEHYLPGKKGKKRKKYTGKSFIRALIINAVIPVRYAFYSYQGKDEKAFETVQLATQLPPENNRITRIYNELGLPLDHAADTQAVLRLNDYYCKRNNCINCAVGKHILTHENHR